MKRHCKTGEPCALKGASTVRGGAVGNVLSDETVRKEFGMSKENKTATRWPPTPPHARHSGVPAGGHETQHTANEPFSALHSG